MFFLWEMRIDREGFCASFGDQSRRPHKARVRTRHDRPSQPLPNRSQPLSSHPSRSTPLQQLQPRKRVGQTSLVSPLPIRTGASRDLTSTGGGMKSKHMNSGEAPFLCGAKLIRWSHKCGNKQEINRMMILPLHLRMDSRFKSHHSRDNDCCHFQAYRRSVAGAGEKPVYPGTTARITIPRLSNDS